MEMFNVLMCQCLRYMLCYDLHLDWAIVVKLLNLTPFCLYLSSFHLFKNDQEIGIDLTFLFALIWLNWSSWNDDDIWRGKLRSALIWKNVNVVKGLCILLLKKGICRGSQYTPIKRLPYFKLIVWLVYFFFILSIRLMFTANEKAL
jgi:hypothetical protein